MAAARATKQLVKDAAGLNDAFAPQIFGLAAGDDAGLDTLIDRAIAVASAWIQQRIDAAIYVSTDDSIEVLVQQGEVYLACHFLLIHPKARRVMGTHAPVETEGSERYEELIDVEFLTLAQELLSPWLIIETPGTNFARPTFRVGTVIDTSEAGFETVLEEFEQTLDRARGGPLPAVSS